MKKRKSLTLNHRILRSFLIFSAAMLIMLWLLEIVFINQFYQLIRTSEIRSISNRIAEAFNSDSDDQQILMELSHQRDVSTIIVNTDENRALTINDINLRQLFGNDFGQKLSLLENYYDSEKSVTLYIHKTEDIKLGYRNEAYIDEYSDRNVVGIISISRLRIDGVSYVIMVFGGITPLESTVSTLRIQLMIVSGILVVFSILVSLLVSRKIARPIEDINNDAKILATGKYDIEFQGRGYREIEELSETLNETADQLQKADQMTKDLIANVSHDLRTPLTMISGYGEIIRDLPGENTPENVQVIIDEANRLTSLVNNLLDISKLQSGTAELNLSVINLNDLLERICGTFRTFMEKHDYRFVLDSDEGTFYVKADGQRLEQVLYNLINNAISHIGDDKVIRIRCRKGNDDVRVDVIDHGSGISPEDLPLIWQRYYKADKQSRPEKGSGLGLSIVKTILDLHDVEYGVESQPGEGADFWFCLPLAESEEN